MNALRKPFRYRNDNIALVIIGINILVFILQQILPRIGYYIALNPINILNGRIWQFGTYMFAHGSFQHLLFNMLALFIFGTQVERHIGSTEFLLYYMLTGILAGFFSFGVYLFTGAFGVFLLGASGAIFAVQLAYAAFFPDSVIYIWGILPLRAPIMVLGFTLVELISSLFGFGSGVAHLTHLAGFGFGWFYFLVRFGRNPWRAMVGR
ncbi:MAG: rhomboid family intramembrane serine protease [Spirochaetaceae bacterium]|nr:rhomboid family intramembrane serine protease [Spirochaetaceae bacterium]